MTFWKRQNYRDIIKKKKKKNSDCQGLGGSRKMHSQSTAGSKGNENTLHDAIMTDTCHCINTFVPTHRKCNTKSEL